MKTLTSSICLLAFLIAEPTNLYACAAPKPFFYAFHAADAIFRGTLETYEMLGPHSARVTFDVLESMRGNLPLGRLSVEWPRPQGHKQQTYPGAVLVALERYGSQGDDHFKIMSGCLVQGIYSTDIEKRVAAEILSNLGR